MRIFISSLFKDLLSIKQCCLELGYYKLGTLDDVKDKEGEFITDIKEISLSQIDRDKGRSPTDGLYACDGIILPDNKVTLSLTIPYGDQGMSDDSYKALYGFYKNKLTGNFGIAFTITGDIADTSSGLFIDYTNSFGEPGKRFNSKPLGLTKERNIITFPIPEYSCTLLVSQDDDDLVFAEGSGVGKNYNINNYLVAHPEKTVDRNFLSKNSFDSYFNSRSSEDNFPHDNTVFINKFGIKIY